jgi:hypothetical protein
MKVTIYNHPDPNRVQAYFSAEAIKLLGTTEIIVTVSDVISIRPATLDDKKFSKISKQRLSSFLTDRDIIGEYTLEKDEDFDDFILTPINN